MKAELDKAKGKLDAVISASNYVVYPHYNPNIEASDQFKSGIVGILANTGFVVGGPTRDSHVKQSIAGDQNPRSGPHISYSLDPNATAAERANELAEITKLQTVLNASLPNGFSSFQLVQEPPTSGNQSKLVAVWF